MNRRFRLVLALALALAGTGCLRGAKADKAKAITAKPPVPVVTAGVKTAPVARDLDVSGTLIARSQVSVLPKTSGRIIELPVAEGDRVRKGQILARLDTPELNWQLQQQRSLLLMAEANLDQARDNLTRNRELAAEGVSSKAQLKAAEIGVRINEGQVKQAKASIALMQTNLANGTITSPVDGVVLSRGLELGSMAGPATAIVTLAAGGDVQARLSFAERDLAMIAEGGKVSVSSAALPGEVFKGRIREISEVVDPQTRLITFKVDLARAGRLKIGMNVKGRVAGTSHSSLVVPTEAVLTDGAEQIVYLARGGKARRVSVQTGLRGPDQTEILSGLSVDDPVIVRGGSFVREGDSVSIKKGV